MRYLLIILFALIVIPAKSQTIPIFYFKKVYNARVLRFMDSSEVDFKEIKLMAGYMFNPDRKERKFKIDYKAVDKYINRLFPKMNATGILCVDLENKYYQDLKGRYINTRGNTMASEADYKKAVSEFVTLIRHIKTKRPNIKVGIYGMPFKIYDKNELKSGWRHLLDPVLKETDVLFPSIYNPHKIKKKSYQFFKLNLDIAFEYADHLDNIPVIPFFWYLLYTAKKGRRYEMIPKDNVKSYLSFIKNYHSPSGKKVSGIIWWDSATQYQKSLIKQNLLKKGHQRKKWSRTKEFFYYFGKE